MGWEQVKPENSPFDLKDSNGKPTTEIGGLAIHEREVIPEVYKKLLEKWALTEELAGKDFFGVVGTANMAFPDIENKIYRWIKKGGNNED